MAEYDLTWRIGSFLDRQLVFPLLEFLQHRQVYDDQQLNLALLNLLKNTKMADFMIETYQTVYNTRNEPPEMVRRREEVKSELRDLKEKTEPIVKILEDDQVSQQIQSLGDRDGKQLMENLQKNHDFHPTMLDTLYKYAKCLYECGNYSGASEYLYFYRLLVVHQDSNYLNALWGKLASEILTQNFDVAKGDIAKLKAYIDNNPFDTDLELLQQRAWLIHWSLFVFFNHPKGRDDIIDMCLLSPNYLSTIQVLCPHILRYLAVAVVTNKKKKQCLKDLVKIIQLEAHSYKDPVTEFLLCLFVNYDFDGAQQKLRACEEVLENDFFLVACVDDFIECSRLLIFEMFCRIHECISIKMLAEKLNMEEEEAERWIVNLIRNAQLDAKIDSTLGHVVMGSKAQSIHEQVMENTKRLSFRAQAMAFQLEKAQKEKAPAWGGGQGYLQ